jgi:mRNA-degrading endonuclease toxin of MazEF toxin-antitoxin module
MNVRRGEVVLVDFPYGGGGSKVRPALVIQNDRDNVRLLNTMWRKLRASPGERWSRRSFSSC